MNLRCSVGTEDPVISITNLMLGFASAASVLAKTGGMMTSNSSDHEIWIPAFAGMTDWVGFVPRFHRART